jgi:hypothetical protein
MSTEARIPRGSVAMYDSSIPMFPKNSIKSQVAGSVNNANATANTTRAFRKSPIVDSSNSDGRGDDPTSATVDSCGICRHPANSIYDPPGLEEEAAFGVSEVEFFADEDPSASVLK